uniref:hypothetical protein n=1 Tax=Alistipes sp. D31t1_170403_E11 TaxID=2787128 RepID=UPI00189B280C|nr:hypothetical protein [Alistipes sp. D31t1_170403_E11]
MKYTFEEIKAVAKLVKRLYYPHCRESAREIRECESMDDLRHLAIKYRDYIGKSPCANYINSECSDELNAMGLRLQLYVDGRARLYLA